MGESCQDKNIDLVVSKIEKQHLAHTNEIIISLYNNLTVREYKSWREKFKDSDLGVQLANRIKALKEEGSEVRIHTKFFAPLENYLSITSNNLDEYIIKAQMYQMVRVSEKKKSYIFLFTNDYDTNISRIKNVQQLFPTDKLYIFKPEGLGISNSDLLDYGIDNVENIIIYDPIELMALITLFVDNYDNEELKEAIVEYTKGL